MSKTIEEILSDLENEEFALPTAKLSEDLMEASKTLGSSEARYLVDAFYIIQDNRKRAANQIKSMGNEEPHTLLDFLLSSQVKTEAQIKTMLDIYTSNNKVGIWARSNMGIGPVTTAGLLAHIDFKKAIYAGHIHSFAGLNDNNREWMGKTKASDAVDEICGKRPKEITDVMIDRLSKELQWSKEYIMKNGIEVSKVITIPRLRKCLSDFFGSDRCDKIIDDICGIDPKKITKIMIDRIIVRINVTNDYVMKNSVDDDGKIQIPQLKKCLSEFFKTEKIDEVIDSLSIKHGKEITKGIINKITKQLNCTEDFIKENAEEETKGKMTVSQLKKCLAKKPYNQSLKDLCWKISALGFKMNKNKPNCFYGRAYALRKEYEQEKSDRGLCSEEAKAGAERVGKTTDAYKFYIEGKIPPAQIDARALRWTIKLFLSHLWYVGRRLELGKEPPLPYVIAHKGHGNMIPAPNLHVIFDDAPVMEIDDIIAKIKFTIE